TETSYCARSGAIPTCRARDRSITPSRACARRLKTIRITRGSSIPCMVTGTASRLKAPVRSVERLQVVDDLFHLIVAQFGFGEARHSARTAVPDDVECLRIIPAEGNKVGCFPSLTFRAVTAAAGPVV